MSDDNPEVPPGHRPSSEAHSRGFVRGAATFIPGAEPLVGAAFVVSRLARCLACRSTWAVQDNQPGVRHPEFNRFGEVCPNAGSWMWTTGVTVK